MAPRQRRQLGERRASVHPKGGEQCQAAMGRLRMALKLLVKATVTDNGVGVIRG